MPKHDLPYAMETVGFPASLTAITSPDGYVWGYGTTVGNGVEGWAPGAFFTDTDASSPNQLWVNEGTATTASWVAVKTGAAGNITIDSGESLTASTGATIDLGDDVPINFGDGSDHALAGSGTDLTLSTENFVTLDEGLPQRYALMWTAGERGKPGVNGDIQSATESVREIADPNFEVVGTNAASALSTYNAEGGIKLTTNTGSADQMILAPHLDANQSPWTSVTWGTDRTVKWECYLTTGSSIADCIIWCGLKLTNTSTIATDNDSVFFRYEAGVNSNKWQTNYSIGGTDTTADSGVLNTVSTNIHFAIRISLTRIATMYMDGVLVATSTALTNTTDLIPYIGVETATTAAKDITVRSQRISRAIA